MWSSARSSSGSLISARKWGGGRNSAWPVIPKRSQPDLAGRLRPLSRHRLSRPRVRPVQSQPRLRQPSLNERPEEMKPLTNGLGRRRGTKPTICSILRKKSFAGPRLLARAPRKQPNLNARLSLNARPSLNEQPHLNERPSPNDLPSLSERPEETRPQTRGPSTRRPPPTNRLGRRRRTKPTICSTPRTRSCAGRRLLARAPRKQLSLNGQPGQNEQPSLSERPK